MQFPVVTRKPKDRACVREEVVCRGINTEGKGSNLARAAGVWRGPMNKRLALH